MVQNPKNTKKINRTIRRSTKTVIVITDRVQNIVLGHRLLHHRIPTIKRSKSHGINKNETVSNLFP
ncbi:MEG-6 [Schistosoma mansoni]|uniref:MEG-6 n=1 Tax=Schistosoma mansoni TaxID=6183 RepID=G4VTX1_SCHMA|nr:MEG-6 [Schistosoma mansoni]|eukprot:XP_018655687.1 MEG-6 [Schistosoma mansoni]